MHLAKMMLSNINLTQRDNDCAKSSWKKHREKSELQRQSGGGEEGGKRSGVLVLRGEEDSAQENGWMAVLSMQNMNVSNTAHYAKKTLGW